MIIILLFNEVGKMLYEVIAILNLRFIAIIYLGMHQKFVCLLPENANIQAKETIGLTYLFTVKKQKNKTVCV